MRSNAARLKESPLTPDESLFLGLVRQGMLTYYVGRAAELTDDELRSVFAVAKAAMREADRQSLEVKAPQSSVPGEQKNQGPKRPRDSDSRNIPFPAGYIQEV